jgi:hypothetical protein
LLDGTRGSTPCVTGPAEKPDDADRDREVGPLGSAVAPPDDPESGGASPGPASGAAGPSYPPAGSEPDAHR